MGSLFDDLKQGLEEAIEYEKGQGKARVKTYMIMPVKEYSYTEIREIRMRAGMTQGVFCILYGCFEENSRGMGVWQNTPNRTRVSFA